MKEYIAQLSCTDAAHQKKKQQMISDRDIKEINMRCLLFH